MDDLSGPSSHRPTISRGRAAEGKVSRACLRPLPARGIRDRQDGVRGPRVPLSRRRAGQYQRENTSLSTPTGCMTAMLGRRRASPTGCLYRPDAGRFALGVCAITPFVADSVAEDPALAAVLAEAFETFPGALDPLALPAVVAGLSDALWRPLRSQDRPATSPRRQHCRKPCACLSRHCDREFSDRGGFEPRDRHRPLQPRSQVPRANRYFTASLSHRPACPSGSRWDRRRACSCRGRRRRRLRRSEPYDAAFQSPLRHYPRPIREIAEKRSNGWTRVVKPTVTSAPPMPSLTMWRGR